MRIGCGCVKLGSASSSASWGDHVRLVRGAVDAGVTVFDTADAYSSGVSELVLGAALRDRRHDVTIATKVGYVFRPRTRAEQQLRRLASRVSTRFNRSRSESGPSTSEPSSSGYSQQQFNPDHIGRALRASLDRLGTDYIDVYQLHGPAGVLDDALGALVAARDAGLVRSIGVGAESLESAIAWSAVPEIDVVQLPFGVLDPEAASSLFGSERISPDRQFWVRGVLGGGVLAAAMGDPAQIHTHPKRQLVLDLIAIADSAGMQLDELAVRWVGGHQDVDTMLVGISSPAHLARIVELGDLPPLPTDVADAVDRTTVAQ